MLLLDGDAPDGIREIFFSVFLIETSSLMSFRTANEHQRSTGEMRKYPVSNLLVEAGEFTLGDTLLRVKDAVGVSEVYTCDSGAVAATARCG